MNDYQVDVIIVGGGLSGAALLRSLAKTDLRVLMIDSQDFFKPLPSNDGRSLTLSIASMRILASLDVWAELATIATPIQRIHVSEQGRFGTACLNGSEQQPLGYVVPIQNLIQSLYHGIDRKMVLAPATVTAFDPDARLVTVHTGDQFLRIQATLIVAADGSHSSMRSLCQLPVQVKDYNQNAVVTYVDLARAHQHTAYERFTESGPLALLPLAAKRMGVVWSLPPEQAKEILAMNDPDFLRELMRVFGYRLGRLIGVGKRMTFPLRHMLMQDHVQGAVVFIGNAAHTLHPVAGQGFNLGLRDVAMLAQTIIGSDIHDPHLLFRYQQARQHDQTAIARFTDGLMTLYGHSSLPIRLARQIGLVSLDNNRLLKRILARYASGLAGVVPDLVCGMSL